MLSATICLLRTSTLLQTEFAAAARLSEGQFFEGWTNLKLREVSEFPSGKSKISNVRG